MTAAREEILDRIRTALADHHVPAPIPRDYRGEIGAGDVELFAERVNDYRASVLRVEGDALSVATAVAARLSARGFVRVVVPAGFPLQWLPPGIEAVDEPVDGHILDAIGAVITTCAVAIAETGTIVLDAGPGMGPRALTLLPDYHLVVVRPSQIVSGVPDAIAALKATRPLTWISGPSATSDIELNRIEGVHGPRVLDVVLAA